MCRYAGAFRKRRLIGWQFFFNFRWFSKAPQLIITFHFRCARARACVSRYRNWSIRRIYRVVPFHAHTNLNITEPKHALLRHARSPPTLIIFWASHFSIPTSCDTRPGTNIYFFSLAYGTFTPHTPHACVVMLWKLLEHIYSPIPHRYVCLLLVRRTKYLLLRASFKLRVFFLCEFFFAFRKRIKNGWDYWDYYQTKRLFCSFNSNRTLIHRRNTSPLIYRMQKSKNDRRFFEV